MNYMSEYGGTQPKKKRVRRKRRKKQPPLVNVRPFVHGNRDADYA